MNMSFIIAIDTSLYVFTCFSNSCTIYAAFVQKLISPILIMFGSAHDTPNHGSVMGVSHDTPIMGVSWDTP